MRILYCNPNATVAMTDSMVAAARHAVPGAEVLGWTNHDGPPAIQGPEDGAAAVIGLLQMAPKICAAGADVVVIGCFDDTGLDQLHAAVNCPVIGIGQAAYHMAALLGGGFSVVTTLQVSVPVLEENIARHGFAGHCLSVRASGLAVLEAEAGGPHVLARLSEEIARAEAEGASSVILGCAGMAHLRETLQSSHKAVIVDGVAASARLGIALAGGNG